MTDTAFIILLVIKQVLLFVGVIWIIYGKKEPKVKTTLPIDRYANNVEMQIAILKLKREYDKVLLKYMNPILNFLSKMLNKLKT